jgi:type III restriction enzyme
MELKKFQRRVVFGDEKHPGVEGYLRAVAEERGKGNWRHGALDAWRELRLGMYQERENGLGEDLPTVCIKVPTGGGKTLLATQILGSAYRTIHKERNGAGLVLWVVPTTQIYHDTLKRLSDRNDMYRLMLEHAVSRRIELWEKDDIVRLTPAKLRECLNVLIVMLPAANRETKEQLKFFRDSGGNIVDHFPPEEDFEEHRKLKERVKNDMIEEDAGRGRWLCKTSVGNLVKICRPVVIVDEGHKATSALARKTIEDFNASLVVELSATPKTVRLENVERRPNVICRVTGKELFDEEMIKLPLNVHTSGAGSWEDLLTKARDKREALARKAQKAAEAAGSARVIRPIVLVQVERTGRDQREAGMIHSEDAREFLVNRLGQAETSVRVKSAEEDEIENEELMDPDNPVCWIITKAALQEGWDCPYAYILVSLNNSGSLTGMTQLVGRVLRQPDQRRMPKGFEELNESYVYVLRARAGEVVGKVKTVLEEEGYDGDVTGLVVNADERGEKAERTVKMRREFANLYTRPFAGKIYLPHFCVKEGKEREPLDYFRHLVSAVDVDGFEYGAIDWKLAEELKKAKDEFAKVTLGGEKWRTVETEVDHLETDEQVLAWMTATLPMEYLSHKQLRRIVKGAYDALVGKEIGLKDRLGTVKFVVRQKVADFIEGEVDKQTEGAFVKLYDKGKLEFYLECKECNFEVPASWVTSVSGQLAHPNGDKLERSLWDYVDQGAFSNDWEKAIALCLDKDANVLWWLRNLIGAEHFAVQGFRRHRIRPDFVVQGATHRPMHHVFVIESKGEHLSGNEDTEYKRKVADYYEKVGKKVSWQQLGKDFKDHVFRFQVLDEAGEAGSDWKDELAELLGA